MMRTLLTAAAVSFVLAAAPHLTHPAQAQGTKTEKAGTTKKAARPLTPGQKAARERQKKCGEEWKAAKAAGKAQKNMTWPKYWSACNKRLKGA